MGYTDQYSALKEVFSSGHQTIVGENELLELTFSSGAFALLPGNTTYACEQHDRYFEQSALPTDSEIVSDNQVNLQDVSVGENRDFSIRMIKPVNVERCEKLVLLFHGFNEKNWEKYLPWGDAICQRTGSAVVFFPIAFHMQRAPMSWSEKREMFQLSEARKKRYPNVLNSTLSNVAISERLHAMPQRFIWSGVQTYYDVIQFLESCKQDQQPLIAPGFELDIFAYSIGGLLAQTLKLANYKGYFEASKVCLFCSGPVFNRLSPVSKFILDSEANVALYSYLIEHFDSYLKHDKHLRHYIDEEHIEGKILHSLLDYQKMRVFREGLLKQVEDNVYAIALAKDTVIPSYEVVNSLQGARRTINIRVDEMDFSYEYIHENPFPAPVPYSAEVDASFDRVFEKIAAFLNA